MTEATVGSGRLDVGPETADGDVLDAVRAWVNEHVPASWREAARRGGADAIRRVRSRDDYATWYPVFGRSGLVAPMWPVGYGGLDLSPRLARRVETELRPYNLGRLNPLGLNLAAPALFAYGTEEQRLRYLPPIVRNDEVWCQLFSEPGAGSDLASLATRAERDGDGWVVTGQKVWTTWAHLADFGVLLARTDPDVSKRSGITYFLLNLRQPGVEVRPLRHLGGEVDFNEVFLDRAYVPDSDRVGEVGGGWRVAGATLSGERQMVSGTGSGGVDRIGGGGVRRLLDLARANAAAGRAGGWDDPVVRQEIMRLFSEERVREWTNQRVRANLKAGRPPGPESSIGKVHQGDLNQRVQVLATDLLGVSGTAWDSVGGPGSGTTAGPAAATPAATGAVTGATAGAAAGGTNPGTGAGTARSAAETDADADAGASHHGPDAYAASLPYEVRGMLRSRANTIEGGTTEVNRTILGERVLGLPREPDPWRGQPWRDVPRR
jgi:alkylation response protein AidB-like acyl-CoA dehydrogenase